VERRIRILMVLAGVNALLALGAIGLIVWMNEDPVYWFPKLAAEQGPKGPAGDKGARGPQGDTGPAGVSGDVAIESRVSDLETSVGDTTSVDLLSSRLDDAETRLDTVEPAVTDLQDSVDTAETSLSSICDALNFANDPNLNGVC
jgi:hypothetical protein